MSPRSFFRSAALLAALVLAASGCGKSHDRIVAPSPVPNPPPGLIDGEAIVSMVTTDSALISATTIGTVRSVDGGASWSLVDKSALSMLATIGEHVFAASFDHIGISDDGGLSWRQLPSSNIAAGYTDYIVAAGNVLLAAGTYEGIHRSTDLGASWAVAIPGPGGYLRSLAAEGEKAVVIGQSSIFRSLDAGATWALTAPLPVPDAYIETVAVSGGRFYASTYPQAIFVSDDGSSWSRTTGDLPNGVNAWRLLSLDGSLFAGTSYGLFRSRDGAASWAKILDPPAGITRDVVTHGGSLFAGSENDGVQRSDDDGSSWSRVHATGGGPIIMTVDGASQRRAALPR